MHCSKRTESVTASCVSIIPVACYVCCVALIVHGCNMLRCLSSRWQQQPGGRRWRPEGDNTRARAARGQQHAASRGHLPDWPLLLRTGVVRTAPPGHGGTAALLPADAAASSPSQQHLPTRRWPLDPWSGYIHRRSQSMAISVMEQGERKICWFYIRPALPLCFSQGHASAGIDVALSWWSTVSWVGCLPSSS